MELKNWLGECVWDTTVMLWLNFGGSKLGIHEVIWIKILDATVHLCVRACPDRADRPPALRGPSMWS
jgi:hypothetical protein